MENQTQNTEATSENKTQQASLLAVEADKKIGLALSGGGFRASIFHLGVIRRLEELGLMKKISVISAVSGGSIIAAYYVVEMERRLRENVQSIAKGTKTLDQVRMELFKEIARDFFTALDKNMRCRAMVFSPFYHPFKWLKTLWPGYSRTNLMAAEYDRWLFGHNTLDQLPSVTERKDNAGNSIIYGPRLLLNATSLIDGCRVIFSREPVCRLKEFSKINKNILKLSSVVGASSCVPGLFPPLSVACDKLVDGGVCDNQGVGAFIDYRDDPDSQPAAQTNPAQHSTLQRREDLDLMLVSDASGQMEQVNALKNGAVTVLSRTMTILQFQIRENLMHRLIEWKKSTGKEFAFLHLYLNVKDRPKVPRVPSEYFPGLGRMRTDLDQFSYIEREALMYHGYTLIDAQIKQHCTEFVKTEFNDKSRPIPPMACPPLFVNDTKLILEKADQIDDSALKRRQWIKKELEAGIYKSFIIRSAIIYTKKMIPFIAVSWALPLAGLLILLASPWMTGLSEKIGIPILNYLGDLVPRWLIYIISGLLKLQCPFDQMAVSRWITAIVILGLAAYIFCFLLFLMTRWWVRKLAQCQYGKLTGDKKPDFEWIFDPAEETEN